MSEFAITPEFEAICVGVYSELGASADQHAALTRRLAEAMPVFSRWSPQMTPRDELKARAADLIAADIAAGLKATKPITPEGPDGRVCNVERAVWDRLSPQNRMALYREWAKKSGKDVPSTDDKSRGRTPNIKRLESELRAAFLVSRTLRGEEKVKQTQRIADLEKQLKDARNG